MVQRGLKYGEGDTITPDQILHAIQRGEMQAWAVRDDTIAALMVFTIREHLGARSIFVVMLAGRDMDGWVDEVEGMLQDYRDIIGARYIRASCRLGLAQKLGQRGWKRSAVIMEAPK
jgi:hypothetical protein